MRILEIKRALLKSRPDVEINAEINKLQDQIKILYQQTKDLKGHLDQKYDQLR